MGRYFHHRLSGAATHTLSQELEQIARLRGGMRGGEDAASGMIFDCSGKHRLSALRTQHRFEEKRSRGLAVGAGDRAQFHLRFRVTEEVGRQCAQRTTTVLYFNDRQRWVSSCGVKRDGRVSDNGARTLRDCLRNVKITVGGASAKSDKQRAVAHPPGIVFNARHRGAGPGTADHIDILQHAA